MISDETNKTMDRNIRQIQLVFNILLMMFKRISVYKYSTGQIDLENILPLLLLFHTYQNTSERSRER